MRLMTVAEEAEFLAPWLEQAKGGGQCLWCLLCGRRLTEKLGKPVSRLRCCIDCWPAMDGARWPPTRVIPKVTRQAQAEWKKNSPQTLASILKPEQVQGRQVRLMFQDEARFGVAETGERQIS